MHHSLLIASFRIFRFLSSTSCQLKRLKPNSTGSFELGNLLLTAHITKTLSESGTQNLNTDSISLSESVVLHVLRKPSLDASRKIEFFQWCFDRNDYKHTVGTYSEIFSTISRWNRYILNDDVVRKLLICMKHDDVIIDSNTIKLLLDAFIKSGQVDGALKFLDQMEELGISLNANVYYSVVIALVRKKELSLALTMFTKLIETYGENGNPIPCDPIACNELLVSLRRAGLRDEFKEVFNSLREKKIDLDTWGYNILIHSLGCWGDLGTSLLLFKEMKESNSRLCSGPNLCTYNSLIHVLCSVGKVKDALIVWDELKSSGHEPDSFTYRIIIQGCSKSYRIEDATKIFNEMQCNGFQPNTVIYNALLDAFLKARKLTEACQLFEKMTQDGVRATCWTYNILIDGLIKNGREIAGYTLFCDLKKKGQFVDGITYSIIVLYLSREGQIDEAFHLVEEMEARGFVVDLVTITSILIGFSKQGRWDLTERLMKHIRDKNLLHDVLKWKANMEALIKEPRKNRKDFTPIFPAKRDFGEIMGLMFEDDNNESLGFETNRDGLDEWSSSPYMDRLANKVKPSARIFNFFSLSKGQRVQDKGASSFDIDMVNTYLSIFLAKGKLSTACMLFDIFTDLGINAASYTYNSLMTSFVKKGYYDQVSGILNEMGENLCPVDIATYNIIIQSLGKMGRADLASSILDKLMKDGGYLDIVMYNTLINALGKDGRLDETLKLFKQMRNSGINPDVVTFNTLIEVHAKSGRIKDAQKYLKMMLDVGCSPNHVTDTILDFVGKEVEKSKYDKGLMECDN